MKKLMIMTSSYPKYYNEYKKKNDYIQLWCSFMEEEWNTRTHTHSYVYMDSHLLTLFFSLTSAPFSIKYLTLSMGPLSAALMRAVSPSLYEYNYWMRYFIRQYQQQRCALYLIISYHIMSCHVLMPNNHIII